MWCRAHNTLASLKHLLFFLLLVSITYRLIWYHRVQYVHVQGLMPTCVMSSNISVRFFYFFAENHTSCEVRVESESSHIKQVNSWNLIYGPILGSLLDALPVRVLCFKKRFRSFTCYSHAFIYSFCNNISIYKQIWINGWERKNLVSII